MVYNPIFEEELERDKELHSLKNSIRFTASQDQAKDVCLKVGNFFKMHPILTTLALGVFSINKFRK